MAPNTLLEKGLRTESGAGGAGSRIVLWLHLAGRYGWLELHQQWISRLSAISSHPKITERSRPIP